MNKLILKGLLMTLITFIASSISTSGFPVNNLEWELLGITSLGTILVYIGQSVIIPSSSVLGALNFTDILKGLIVAIGNGLSSIAASAIVGTKIDYHVLLVSVGSVIMGYFVKQFASTPTGVPPVK